MNGIFIGHVIKQRREELRLSQEELCDGICTTATLSRIENGKQAPSYNRMNALLQRLGLPENRYYALMSKEELEIEQLQKRIINHNISYHKAEGTSKITAYNQGQSLLAKLENIVDKDDVISQQFILRSKAILCNSEDNNWLEKQRKLLLDAIRLTVPKFDEEDISSRIYNLDEIKIIIQIAVNCTGRGQHKKAIDLLGQLLKYVQKHFGHFTQSAKQLSHIAHNYALELAFVGRYDDAIEVAELGRRTAMEYGYYYVLPGIAHIMAECHYRLGNVAKSRELYYQAYYGYKIIDNERDRITVEAEAKEFLDLEFR